MKYVYDHCDGPFCMQTVSYVVEHRQRYLGLEFRTANAELAPVYRQVVDSFAFNLGSWLTSCPRSSALCLAQALREDAHHIEGDR